MSRPPTVVLLWALFLAVLGAVAVAVFEPSDPETPALFGGMTLLMVVIGAYLAARRGGAATAGDSSPRVVHDSSVPTVWFALSLALLALGAELGTWLALIAGGMLLVGLGGLLRESRASRELRDAALGEDDATAGGEGGGPRFELPGEG